MLRKRVIYSVCSAGSLHRCGLLTIRLEENNLIIETDRGVTHDCATASYIMGIWSTIHERYQRLVAHGTFLGMPLGVFDVEAIALEEATDRVLQLMQSIFCFV